MNILNIKYATELSFNKVVEFIPLLTSDNDVVTDGKITHFEIQYSDAVVSNLFYDSMTGHFCLDNTSNEVDESSYLIGEFIQSMYGILDNENLIKTIMETFKWVVAQLNQRKTLA